MDEILSPVRVAARHAPSTICAPRGRNHARRVTTDHPRLRHNSGRLATKPCAHTHGRSAPSRQERLMTEHTAHHTIASRPMHASLRETAREITRGWWTSLATGIAWLVVSLVILQFDRASITTVGILVGALFMLAGIRNLALATVPSSLRWVSAAFGVLFLIAAVICFVNPTTTFVGLADMLGFLFLIVGVWWMVRAGLQQPVNPLWWLGLISGILMTGLAFWTTGQFFIDKAYVLLVFAGIWALMEGIQDIVRAFAMRRVHDEL
jgi:uncharacterized membrane protein HdeD (DUF308 family)